MQQCDVKTIFKAKHRHINTNKLCNSKSADASIPWFFVILLIPAPSGQARPSVGITVLLVNLLASITLILRSHCWWKVYFLILFYTPAGFGRYNYMLVAVCTVSLLSMTLETFGTSYVVAAAVCDLGLTTQTKGIISAMPMLGE